MSDDGSGRPLTERQVEVLVLMAAGFGTSGIARQLGITYATGKFHIRDVRTRLGARTQAHAVAIGYQRGILHVVVPEQPRCPFHHLAPELVIGVRVFPGSTAPPVVRPYRAGRACRAWHAGQAVEPAAQAGDAATELAAR